MTTKRVRSHGFTLLELLLVVLILAMLAASTSSMVDAAHDQARYDENDLRHEAIRRAIAGTTDPTAAIGGYVADVGAVPTTIQQLLEPPPGVTPYRSAGTADGVMFNVGSGWRGPYLDAPRGPNGVRAFPDGWGNPDQVTADPNYGWMFEDLGDSSRRLTSLGADGALGPAPGGVLDYAVDDARDILRSHHHLDIRTLTFGITIRSAHPSQTPVDVGLRLVLPDGLGGLRFMDGLGQTVNLLPGDNEFQLSFLPEPMLSEAEHWIPHGLRAIELRSRAVGPGTSSTLRGEYALVELRAGGSTLLPLRRLFTVGP